MLRRSAIPVALVALAALGITALGTRAQGRRPGMPLELEETRFPITAFAAPEQTASWPPAGTEVPAAAAECVVSRAGPVHCRPVSLRSEIDGSDETRRAAQCYALRPVRLGSADLRRLEIGEAAQPLVLVREISHERETVFGRCLDRGPDACMGGGRRQILGTRVIRHVSHEVRQRYDPRAPEPYPRVRSSLPWLAPWPAPASGHPPDESVLDAAMRSSPDSAHRFAASANLVVARLLRSDVSGAKEALRVASDLARALLADPSSRRGVLLHGAPPHFYVPRLLDELRRATDWRWSDPCAGARPDVRPR